MAFKTERNFRIHCLAAFFVVVAGFLVQLTFVEWALIALVIGLVMAAEVLNTAIEYLADTLHPEMDPGIRRAKDAAAGGVLIASVAAAVVGAIVFIPKLWEWLSKS